MDPNTFMLPCMRTINPVCCIFSMKHITADLNDIHQFYYFGWIFRGINSLTDRQKSRSHKNFLTSLKNVNKNYDQTK